MKHIFATYGTPRRIETDNGPPFNSREFKEFGREEGFEHHNITPLHPRANGEAERFMQMLNKTERVANLQGKIVLIDRTQYKTC
jgi:transposase InsO family protein